MVASSTRTAPAAGGSDPLLDAVNAFIFGGDAYDALPEDMSEEEERTAFCRLCSEPDDVLAKWQTPATTHEGAVAALRLALSELEQSSEPAAIVVSLIKAALGYFDSRAVQ